MEVLEDFQHVSKHLFTHTCTFNKSNMAGSSRVGVKMCTLMEGSRRSPCVLHERKTVYTCGHLFSRMNSLIMPHTLAASPATANRFFAFAAAHTDREPHIRDWQNVCIIIRAPYGCVWNLSGQSWSNFREIFAVVLDSFPSTAFIPL